MGEAGSEGKAVRDHGITCSTMLIGVQVLHMIHKCERIAAVLAPSPDSRLIAKHCSIWLQFSCPIQRQMIWIRDANGGILKPPVA
jgi:hypothetical protein